MEVVFADDNFGFAVRDALARISPAADRLDGRFHGFHAGVHGEDHLHAAQAGQFLDEGRQLVVAEGARSERDARGLLLKRLEDARMAMALVERGVGAETIHVALAVNVVSPNSAGVVDDYLEGAIVVGAPTVFDFDEVPREIAGIGIRHEDPLVAGALAGDGFRHLGGGGSQMGGDLGGFLDGAREDGADLAILQHEQAGDGAAGGGGDIVA